MSISKRIAALIFALVAAISIMAGGVFCSADDVFGTPEEGIYQIGKSYWIHRYTAYKGGDGLANGDFQQGYKYWAQNFGKKCSDLTSIKTEGDNKYLHFNGEQCQSNYEGITSVRFTAKGVEPGSPVAILYKWRGDTQFQLYLEQWDMNAEENGGVATRVSSSVYTKVIYEAFEEGEWNIGVTSAADGTKVVTKPTQGSDEYFFIIGIQITTDPTAVFDIDDVQMVYRQDNGIVKSLKGEQLYDLNNLETRVIEETDMDFSDFDFDSKKVEMPGPSGMASSKAVIKDAGSTVKDIASSVINPASPWFWVVVSAGVLIIIAAVVVIILLIKKKKSSESEESAEETAEETAAEEEIDAPDEASDEE